MKKNRLGTLVFLYTLLISLTIVSCNLNLDPQDSSQAYNSLGYNFFNPMSEQDLIENSRYGYIIAKCDDSISKDAFKALDVTVMGVKNFDGYNYYLLYKDSDVLNTLNKIRKTSGVLFAEPDQIIYGDYVVNDKYAYSEEYSLQITDWDDAYKAYGFGPNTPIIAVIDSGVNAPHEDFSNSGQSVISVVKSMYQADGVTEISEGSAARDVPLTDNEDGYGHGTHVTGTIAAVGDNTTGVAGICWQSKIISIKGLNNNNSGSWWSIYGALFELIKWKKDNNITTTMPLNLSLGGAWASAYGIDAVNSAIKENIVVIAAMGNDGIRSLHYPAAYQGVIAIGATNGRDEKAVFSNMGNHISVSAPGLSIISTQSVPSNRPKKDGYVTMSGTSMATPFVTGLVGYMLTFNPNLKATQIKTILEMCADDKGTKGFDFQFGHGRVNVLKTIAMVKSGIVPPVPYTDDVVAVSVKNLDPGFHGGYHGDPSAVLNQSVYLYDSKGLYVASSITNSQGKTYFSMLKAGTYTIKVNYYNNYLSKTITIKTPGTSSEIPVILSANIPVYNIQTVKNLFYNSGNDATDSIISIYDENLVMLTQYDVGSLDSIVYPFESGKKYYIQVSPYTTLVGNYGFIVKKGLPITEINLDDQRTDPVIDSMEDDDSSATAKLIIAEKEYALYLQIDESDWFYFVVP